LIGHHGAQEPPPRARRARAGLQARRTPRKHPIMIVGADKKCFKLSKKECEESEK
jgi:hypothetical protein